MKNTDPIRPGESSTSKYTIGGFPASEFAIVHALPGTTNDCAGSGFAPPSTNTAADFTYPLTDHCPNYCDIELD